MDHIANISEETILLTEKYIERAHKGVKRASESVSFAAKRLAAQRTKCEYAEAAHSEAHKELREWQEMLDHALVLGRKVLYGQALKAEIDKLRLYIEDEELKVESPCLVYSLDARHTKLLVDNSPFVKRSHIAGNSVLMELKGGKTLKPRDIRTMDYHNIVAVSRVDERPRTSAANMFTNRCGIANALDRVSKAASSDEGKVVFSRELLLEMGVTARAVRHAIKAIGDTANGRVYEANELLFLKTEDTPPSPTVIANPINYKSQGVFCALADPKEALGVLDNLFPGLVNKKED